MTLLRNIGIGMSADTRDFTAELLRAAEVADALDASLTSLQSSTAGLSFDLPKTSGGGAAGGGAGPDADAIGAQFDLLAGKIGVALKSAMAPLGTFAAAFGRQFSQVGGTVLETSKRVASAMKVMGGESLGRMFRDAIPDAERFGVVVNDKTFRQILGMSHQTENSVRTFGKDLGNAGGSGASALGKLNSSFSDLGKTLDVLITKLTVMAAKMTTVGAAGGAAGPKLFDPSRAGAAARVKGGPEGPRQYNRDELGRFTAGPTKLTGDLGKATSAMHQLGAEAKLTERGVGEVGQSLSTKLLVNTKDFSFLSGKGASSSLGKQGPFSWLNRSIQETSLLGAQFRTLSPVINSAAGSARRFGATLAIGLGVAGIGVKSIQMLVGFVKGGTKGATALNETLSKTSVVFGSSAAKVAGQAETMAKAFGLPKQAMLDAASSIGLIAKGAGLGQQQAAGLANTFSQLAADASSFYNIPLDAALEKIRAGLVGQSEPLRSFGIVMTEDSVKAEAVRMGIAKLGDELSEQSKVAARSSLIMNGLKDATGDLSRTSDSAANMSRKFHGQLENLSTKVGEALIPALTNMLSVGSEVVDMLSEGFDRFKGTTEGFVSSFVAGFDLVGVAIRNLPDFLEIASIKVMEWGVNFLATLETIPANFKIMTDYLGKNWFAVMWDMNMAASTAIQNLTSNWMMAFSALFDFMKDPSKGFQFNWLPLLDGFKATAEALPELLKPEITSMQGDIDKITDRIGAREAARTKGAAAMGKQALPGFGKNEEPAKDKKTREKQKEDVGALEIGSKEAVSAVAQFRNQGASNEAKQTAKATIKAASTLDKILEAVSRDQGRRGDVQKAISNL